MLLCAAAAFAGTPLDGTWRMSASPDGQVVEEWMRFDPAGTAELGNAKGV